MTRASSIDGMLVQWGDRLFYPGSRMVRDQPQVKLRGRTEAQRAADIRQRIRAVVSCRAPQVMVRVTGGGRGIRAIAAHFRYASKSGKLEMENERGEILIGSAAVRDAAEEWRYGGSFIGDHSSRREAYNIMLSMPRGTDPQIVQRAARDFARQELAGHKYVMVLHDHQANPHVHICVRAESKHGRRLNPRKADLHRWRETFAAKLRERGIEAEATRQATRGSMRRYTELWRVKAAEDGRLVKAPAMTRTGAGIQARREAARLVWREIAAALIASGSLEDQRLGLAVESFAAGMAERQQPARSRQVGPALPMPQLGLTPAR